MARMGLRKETENGSGGNALRAHRISHCFGNSLLNLLPGSRSNWRGVRQAAAVLFVTAATLASNGAQAYRSAESQYDQGNAGAANTAGSISVNELPREAVGTLSLIAAGGPFPYEKDGVVFGNFERALPKHRRGYYHEYTVPTPRARNRGAKRIVCGGPLGHTDNCYYSDDHYASFRRIID